MDDLLLSHILEESKSSVLRDDPRSLAILKDEVEKIKIRLSSRKSATVDLPSGKFFDLTRRKLEKILSPLLEKFRAPIRIALKQARLTAADIDHIVLVGGPTHMPCVRRIIADELEKLGVPPKLLAEFDSIEKKGFPVNPMECVSQGAALAAGNVMKPVSTVVSEGYGTKFGDFYSPIIKVNSSYPNNGNQKITYGDPNLKHVLVSLIAKTPDIDNSSSSNITYKYESLGDVSISIEPTGDAPNVDLQLEITEDKRLIATITHTQTHQQVSYESLDLLVGNVIQLQEDKEPKPWSKEKRDSIKQRFTPNSGWTKESLQSCVHIATQALELARGSDYPKVTKAVRRLRSIIKQTNGRQSDPKCHGPDLANRTKELFDRLRLPATELITECQYRDYMRRLSSI
jgi:molecular chaperone DnaK (HSP70)